MRGFHPKIFKKSLRYKNHGNEKKHRKKIHRYRITQKIHKSKEKVFLWDLNGKPK